MDKQKNAEKVVELIKNKDFLLKLSKVQTDEEARQLFLNNGAELDFEKAKVMKEAVDDAMKKTVEELSEEDLANVAGGTDSIPESVSDKVPVKKIVSGIMTGVLITGAVIGTIYEGIHIYDEAKEYNSLKGQAKGNLRKAGNIVGNLFGLEDASEIIAPRTTRQKIEGPVIQWVADLIKK